MVPAATPLSRARDAWRRRLHLLRPQSERGMTLVELVTTMTILGIVLGGLTTALVTASKHEASLNTRFQAQQSVRLALTTLRRELHCASAVSPTSGTTSSITLTLPTGCPTGTGSVTWCAVAGSTGYDLWRVPGATCATASGVRWARGLTASQPFTPDATVHAGAPALPDVGLVLSVAQGQRSYTLTDTIYLRNGVRQ